MSATILDRDRLGRKSSSDAQRQSSTGACGRDRRQSLKPFMDARSARVPRPAGSAYLYSGTSSRNVTTFSDSKPNGIAKKLLAARAYSTVTISANVATATSSPMSALARGRVRRRPAISTSRELLHRIAGGHRRQSERGHQAEQHAGEQRHPAGDGECGSVERQVGEVRRPRSKHDRESA